MSFQGALSFLEAIAPTRLWTQDAEDENLADFQYAYDAFGRLTVKTEDGVVTTYAYDATNQLTGEDFATGTDGAYTVSVP